MIRVDIRAKRYGASRILGAIAFDVAPGDTVALVGPSGVGKSTLLRLIAGIDHDFDGKVQRPDAKSIVFQEPTLLPWRSALDNLRIVHPNLDHADASRMLAEVGLDGKEAYFPGQLSLGQQRRLSLARAFAGAPKLLVMDEPFVSLDKDTADAMLGLTERLIQRVKPATVFVTHNRAEAERLADRVLALVSGPDGATIGSGA